jgi:hypothetical protein
MDSAGYIGAGQSCSNFAESENSRFREMREGSPFYFVEESVTMQAEERSLRRAELKGWKESGQLICPPILGLYQKEVRLGAVLPALISL